MKPLKSTTPPAMIDIGVNLTHSQLVNDLESIITDATAVGVAKMVVTGTCENSSRQAIELCDRYPQLVCTAGIHPHDAKTFTPSTRDSLARLCQHQAVRAIGETGLDFNRNYSSPQAQEYAFIQHIELASEQELPLFLHERDAHQRQWEILKYHRDAIHCCVIHCFTGSREALFGYLDLDCHIGITGWICDERRGKHLIDIAANIPLDRLMVETDAPFLLPRDLLPKPKSRRNEPKYLPHIVNQIARCYACDNKAIAQATTATATRFFNLDGLSKD